MNTWGFLIGVLFGAGLFLAGLANPDKIVGALRLKDLHAIRVIALFLLVGMLGVWVLGVFGVNHYKVEPATILSVLIGGALLGIGFGLTGYCPGTGLACAAAGRLDAVVAVLGMLVGALLYILFYPSVAVPLEQIANYGKVMLPDITGIPRGIWVAVLVIGGGTVVWLTRPRRAAEAGP